MILDLPLAELIWCGIIVFGAAIRIHCLALYCGNKAPAHQQ